MSDKQHYVSSIRIGVVDLWQLITEVLHLRKQVTELQENSTRLLLENRALRAAYLKDAHPPNAAPQLDAVPGDDGAGV